MKSRGIYILCAVVVPFFLYGQTGAQSENQTNSGAPTTVVARSFNHEIALAQYFLGNQTQPDDTFYTNYIHDYEKTIYDSNKDNEIEMAHLIEQARSRFSKISVGVDDYYWFPGSVSVGKYDLKNKGFPVINKPTDSWGFDSNVLNEYVHIEYLPVRLLLENWDKFDFLPVAEDGANRYLTNNRGNHLVRMTLFFQIVPTGSSEYKSYLSGLNIVAEEGTRILLGRLVRVTTSSIPFNPPFSFKSKDIDLIPSPPNPTTVQDQNKP